ncbi:flagellar basal body-associated FliL family protein [Caloranaerobacter azorensis]|nr:flagellar basal body-associated FliL family protein [Caloranaerobacter azorensis]QIB26186.1 flagellar basal body-associated FliL family protein [Caloranaerobacter azorensis]
MNSKKILVIAVVILVVSLILVAVFSFLYIKSKTDVNKPKEKFYFEVGEMYSNVKDSSSIVKINITVEVTDKELLKILEKKKFLINNQINEIIRSKTEKELEGSNGQILLQKEITEKLAELFNTKDITNIYFKELIVQ